MRWREWMGCCFGDIDSEKLSMWDSLNSGAPPLALGDLIPCSLDMVGTAVADVAAMKKTFLALVEGKRPPFALAAGDISDRFDALNARFQSASTADGVVMGCEFRDIGLEAQQLSSQMAKAGGFAPPVAATPPKGSGGPGDALSDAIKKIGTVVGIGAAAYLGVKVYGAAKRR